MMKKKNGIFTNNRGDIKMYETQLKKLLREVRSYIEKDMKKLNVKDINKLRDLEDVNCQYNIGFYDGIKEALRLFKRINQR